MAFKILLDIHFYKVGCRKLFIAEHDIRGIHFRTEGRKWSHYVIKCVEIKTTFINPSF